MASYYWAKFYIEILDDPKMGRLSDRLWRRTCELILLAKERNTNGALPPLSDMAWRLRLQEDELEQDLEKLAGEGIEIVEHRPDGWFIVNFAKRQAADSNAERQKRHKERQRKGQYYGDDEATSCESEDNDVITNRNAEIDLELEEELEKKREEIDGANAPKTLPPSPPISGYSQTSEKQAQLQQKHGTDPLNAMVKFAQRQEAKSKGRPPGWGSVSNAVWLVCELVAEQFPCTLPVARQSYNASTREMALQQIDKWTGGATLLLEKFNGDAGRTRDAITAFRREFDGGFTVAGPQSLVNSVGPGLASKPTSKSWKRGQRSEGYEPHSPAERAAAWAQYEGDLGRFIEERGTDENLGAVADEFAAFIGRDIGMAQAVLEARAVKRALAEEPLAVGAEAIEAFFAEG